MSTKSREVIFGSRIRGAKIRAEGAREEAKKAVRETDRAEAEAWSIRMEGYGGPAQPAPTLARGRMQSVQDPGEPPARRHPQAAGHADLEARGRAQMPIMQKGSPRTAGAHDQADAGVRDHALRLGAPGRGAVIVPTWASP